MSDRGWAQATSLSFGFADFESILAKSKANRIHPWAVSKWRRWTTGSVACERHAPLGIFTALFRISRHTRSYADHFHFKTRTNGTGSLAHAAMKKPQRRGDSGLFRFLTGGTVMGRHTSRHVVLLCSPCGTPMRACQPQGLSVSVVLNAHTFVPFRTTGAAPPVHPAAAG